MLIKKDYLKEQSATPFPTIMAEARAEARVMGNRLNASCVSVSWLPELKIYHQDPSDLAAVCRQKYRHGSGRPTVWNDPPSIEHLVQRYFLDPLGIDLPLEYVAPAHLAFLMGYRDALDARGDEFKWWSELLNELPKHIPLRHAWVDEVEDFIAPMAVCKL